MNKVANKLSPDEQGVLEKWREKNNAAWDEDIWKAARLAAGSSTSQGDAADYRAQAQEMRALKASGADHARHIHSFGFPRGRCLCDQQWTHPNCRQCR